MSASAYPNVYNGTLLDEIIHEQKLSASLVKNAAREVFAIIREGLLRDGVVRIAHFGTFKLKRVAARKGRNPQTGESIAIPGRAKVIFSPCKALREMIEPVHAKPIPIPQPITTPVTKSVIKPVVPAVAARAAAQPIPELTPEPALLKTESEASSIAIERIPDFDDERPQRRKWALHEKLVFAGIAATIIAVVAIKSMPRNRVEPLSQAISSTTVVEPMVVAEIPLQPVETFSEPEVVVGTEITAPEESESELAQIIASQTEHSRIELESAVEDAIPATLPESVVNDEPVDTPIEVDHLATVAATPEEKIAEAAVTEEVIQEAAIDEPVTEPLATQETAEALPMDTVVEPAIEATVEPMQAAPEYFFTERPYKLQSGNSLWRLSKRFYSEPLYWPYIYFTNSDTVTNPDMLREGRTIIMPTLEGNPGNLTTNDREGISEGYFLTYLFYKKSGHRDAFFALLEAKRYSAEVVERKRHTLTLSAVENIMLDQQEVVANL